MSEIADRLIDIEADTPNSLKPTVRPLLAGLMQQSMELDRVHRETVQIIRDGNESACIVLQDEIAQLEQDIIGAKLGCLCDTENLERSLIVPILAPRCRIDGGELVILDEYGVSTSFEDAVLEIGDTE